MTEALTPGNAPRVLLVASEAVPLIKTGGLADVCGALPAALNGLGCDARLLLPAYRPVPRAGFHKLTSLYLPGLPGAATLLEGKLPGTGITTWLLDYAPAYDRDGHPYLDADGEPWPDNAERFALLARAAVAIATDQAKLDWVPDLVHCNDWQTALVPALLHGLPQRPATVFTIHNLAYQGVFPAERFTSLGLPPALWSHHGLEFYGQLSFIKGGLQYADWVTTVSPNYAQEIQTAEFGCGLDGLLRHRAARLRGILNGIDDQVWNPASDMHLAAPYDTEHLDRKRENKKVLLAEMKLPTDNDVMLAGFIGRLVEQKGIDLILDALPGFADEAVRFVFLGSGDRGFEQRLQDAQTRYPQQVSVRLGYDETLAHRIEAGADVFMMPSRFEPCGLNQMYSLRYGTLPLVRRTGGLADTVTDTTLSNLAYGSANGFVFEEATAAGFGGVLSRALSMYRRPPSWRRIMRSAMAADHSWSRSAENYLELYRAALAERRGRAAVRLPAAE